MKLNCIIIDDELHAISELSELINLNANLNLLNTFVDARDAIAYLQEISHVDIVFSDISMPALNGLNAGKMLNKYCKFLIYVTAHREFALDAFGVNAAGYLTKPVIYLEFMERMEIVFEKYGSAVERKLPKDAILFVKGGLKNSFIKINYNHIVYIEALLNYIIIHTESNSYITYITLKKMEEKLINQEEFFRISKSIIVSLNYVTKVDGNMVMMSNRKSHELGVKYKSVFLEFLKKRTLNP